MKASLGSQPILHRYRRRTYIYIPVERSEIPEELFVSTKEAYKSLRLMKTRKASGPDKIPNIILKTFAFEITPVIADIYNTALCKVYLPSLPNSAAVNPIPKDIEKHNTYIFDMANFKSNARIYII